MLLIMMTLVYSNLQYRATEIRNKQYNSVLINSILVLMDSSDSQISTTETLSESILFICYAMMPSLMYNPICNSNPFVTEATQMADEF